MGASVFSKLDQPELNITREINVNSVLSNITFTTHKILGEAKKTYDVDDLTIENIDQILFKDLEYNNAEKVINTLKLDPQLRNADFLKKMSGVYVHTPYEGIVLIKGPKQEKEHVVSISL